MRRWFAFLAVWFTLSLPLLAADGRIYKVLPQFLDTNGLNSISPSLYDRDTYQARLRRNPAQRGGMQFAIDWKASGPKTTPLILRVELRGVTDGDLPRTKTLEVPVHPHGWFSHWAYLKLTGKEYEAFGLVTAWRATLWDGGRLLSEQKSFLW